MQLIIFASAECYAAQSERLPSHGIAATPEQCAVLQKELRSQIRGLEGPKAQELSQTVEVKAHLTLGIAGRYPAEQEYLMRFGFGQDLVVPWDPAKPARVMIWSEQDRGRCRSFAWALAVHEVLRRAPSVLVQQDRTRFGVIGPDTGLISGHLLRTLTRPLVGQVPPREGRHMHRSHDFVLATALLLAGSSE